MKDKSKKYGWLLPFLVLTAFFTSFSAASYFYINSGNLVISRGEDEIRKLTEKLGEKDSEITELKYQLDRLEALYEKELSENPPLEINEASQK